MRKVFKLQDLDCANCAAKMEDDIGRLGGVKRASVSFMAQKLVIETDGGGDLDALLAEAQSICSKYEPDCTIVR